MMSRTLQFLFFFYLVSTPLHSQDLLQLGNLENFVVTEMERNNIVGAAVVVVNDKGPVFLKGYGFKNKEGEPVLPGTKFDVGSLTKSFTAMAILQFVDEGKIGLEDYVVDFLPDFKTSNPEYSSKIRIRHLLNHTSGFSTLHGNRMQSAGYDEPDALDVVVKDLEQVTLKFKAGEHTAYSNANYSILGLIIERITGNPYEQYIQNRIFDKLNMDDSEFGFEGDVALPFRYFLGIPVQYEFKGTRDGISSAGVTTSIRDLGQYMSAILRRDTSLLSPGAYKRIFDLTSAPDNHTGTYGWMNVSLERDGKIVKFLYHDGLAPGFQSNMILFPAEGYGIAITINTSGGTYGIKSSDRLMYGVLDNLLGFPRDDDNQGLRIVFAIAWVLPLFFLYKGARVVIHWTKRRRVLNIALQTLFALLFCFFCFKYLPNTLGGVGFKTAYIFAPETGLLLLLASATLVVWTLLEWGRLTIGRTLSPV